MLSHQPPSIAAAIDEFEALLNQEFQQFTKLRRKVRRSGVRIFPWVEREAELVDRNQPSDR
jgi:hypothetical protein